MSCSSPLRQPGPSLRATGLSQASHRPAPPSMARREGWRGRPVAEMRSRTFSVVILFGIFDCNPVASITLMPNMLFQKRVVRARREALPEKVMPHHCPSQTTAHWTRTRLRDAGSSCFGGPHSLMLRGAALLPLPARLAARRSACRRFAQRAPPSTRPRAEMAAEAEPKDRVGFKRAEMFSEPLYGAARRRLRSWLRHPVGLAPVAPRAVRPPRRLLVARLHRARRLSRVHTCRAALPQAPSSLTRRTSSSPTG